MTIDVLCPVYWIDELLFKKNIKSWFRELPLARVLLGINNKEISEYVWDLCKKYENIEVIEQYDFKTLGGCLAGLMKRVETDWFAYLHSDAFLSPYLFSIMREYMKDDIGIIESERFHWKGEPRFDYHNFYHNDRAFSGFQLFRTKIIKELVNKIDDDYIYRNEDLIFQSECVKQGYKYVKTLAMHVHQNFNGEWTHDREKTNEMQWKGLIKYAVPNEITIKAFLTSVKASKELRLKDFYDFAKQENEDWCEVILEGW